MTNGPPELTPDLRRSRRALEGVPGVLLLEDWRWNDNARRWVLHCQLAPTGISAGSPLHSTTWYVLAEPLYPLGAVKCYPAKVGGLVGTYPHQHYNGVGDERLPWRTGALCLETDQHILGRQGADEEPATAGERLRWHIERAMQWLAAAEQGLLLAPGDPYELPQFPGDLASGWRVGFMETSQTPERWVHEKGRAGLVTLVPLPARTKLLVAKQFGNVINMPIIQPEWGTLITEAEHEQLGIWLRLDGCPLVSGWQVPATWGELQQAFEAQGFDLDALLQPVVPKLRDGQRYLSLIGFPIPNVVGEPASRIHWQALRLPVLSSGKQTVNGFRPNERGYWLRDQRLVLRADLPLDWLASENWEPEQRVSRGRLAPTLTSRRVLLIGAGALGSAVAELLVRGGVTEGMILDDQRLMAGNLVRHTLTLPEVGLLKAALLVTRLNRISPAAKLHGSDEAFPPQTPAINAFIQKCDLVIDCTGQDDVLEELARFPWERPKWFVSLSIGRQAQRLWCFAATGERFPHDVFRARLEPWLEREQEQFADIPFPREGIGCWHPVFPARADDIWLLASVAIKHMEAIIVANQVTEDFTIFEQVFEDGQFMGVRKQRGDNVRP
jgi:hypothetical protein